MVETARSNVMALTPIPKMKARSTTASVDGSGTDMTITQPFLTIFVVKGTSKRNAVDAKTSLQNDCSQKALAGSLFERVGHAPCVSGCVVSVSLIRGSTDDLGARCMPGALDRQSGARYLRRDRDHLANLQGKVPRADAVRDVGQPGSDKPGPRRPSGTVRRLRQWPTRRKR